MTSIFTRTSHKWVFGPYMVFAESRHSARKAVEILQQEDDHLHRHGTMCLESGETVQWVNFVRNPNRGSARFSLL